MITLRGRIMPGVDVPATSFSIKDRSPSTSGTLLRATDNLSRRAKVTVQNLGAVAITIGYRTGSAINDFNAAATFPYSVPAGSEFIDTSGLKDALWGKAASGTASVRVKVELVAD